MKPIEAAFDAAIQQIQIPPACSSCGGLQRARSAIVYCDDTFEPETCRACGLTLNCLGEPVGHPDVTERQLVILVQQPGARGEPGPPCQRRA